MDVIFGKMLEVPMYQNVKVKSEPLSNTNNQTTAVTVSVTCYNNIMYVFSLFASLIAV